MIIHFYEKPGCINNTQQKRLLESNGHTVIAHSLLTEVWQAEGLRSFFGSMAVAEWFNKAAPRVKNGEIVPGEFDENSAIAAMLDDPLLIRRPLIEAEGQRVCGFDNPLVNKLLNNADTSHLQSCPNLTTNNSCD